jgi:toxin FitB
MIILDTNMLSELMRPGPAPQVMAWFSRQTATELFTTAITEGEILLGIEVLPKGKRREALLGTAETMFGRDLGGRIIGFDSEAARAYAKIVAHRRSLGRPISHADAQIAAIVQLRDAKLATRNVPDFSDCGIQLLNPWDAA